VHIYFPAFNVIFIVHARKESDGQAKLTRMTVRDKTLIRLQAITWICIWIFSRQGPQTGASHRRAVMCEQLAQGCYLRVQWLGVKPPTSRSLGPTC